MALNSKDRMTHILGCGWLYCILYHR